MPDREYRCAECGGLFVQKNIRGRPRVSCPDCAPKRVRRQISEWEAERTAEQRQERYQRGREDNIARATAWNSANPDRRSQITRRDYQRNREVRLAAGREWREANPDKMAAYSLHHSAKRRGAKGEMDADTMEYIALLRHDPCSYCGGPAGEIDHITSVGHDGTNHWTNYTAACRSCNASKSANDLLTYFIRRE